MPPDTCISMWKRPIRDAMESVENQFKSQLDEAAHDITNAGYIVALAGAGLSVESGIPPYRGPGGLWTKYGEPSLLSFNEFKENPRAWWENRLLSERENGHPIREMKLALDRAIPNPGHYSLKALEDLHLLKSTITQNVDNLQTMAGTKSALEIHGNRTLLRCLGCGARQKRTEISFETLPPICKYCNGIIKMDTVMFGEPIPKYTLEQCMDAVDNCDCMLLIGTSGTVNPAAQLPMRAHKRGARLIEINPEKTPFSPICHSVFTGKSGFILPLLVDHIRSILRPNKT